jgi:hypothetical protein
VILRSAQDDTLDPAVYRLPSIDPGATMAAAELERRAAMALSERDRYVLQRMRG